MQEPTHTERSKRLEQAWARIRELKRERDALARVVDAVLAFRNAKLAVAECGLSAMSGEERALVELWVALRAWEEVNGLGM